MSAIGVFPRMRLNWTTAAFVGCLGTLAGAQTPAGDWPQFRGPSRSGISQETGLLPQWPAAGPSLAWTVKGLGAGYGSMSLSGDHLFVQGLRDEKSIVSALSRADGRALWSKALGAGRTNEQGHGPRGTPTVDGDRLYVLTEMGDLACLKTDGTAVWQRNILKEFGGSNPYWLLSESPLIDGSNVIVSPGGRDAGIVALDKMTGKTVWTSKGLSDRAAYSSAILATVGGVRTIMNFTADAAVGVRASDGKLMWRHAGASNNTANIAMPVLAGDRVFFSSAYGAGGALLGLRAAGGEVRAQEIYHTTDMQNHHGGMVVLGGYLYGYHNSILACIDLATGNTMWRSRGVGKGSMVAAEGHLYIVGENREVALVEASPKEFKLKGRFQVGDESAPTWAHPVVAGGRLYIRNQGTVSAYDIRASR
jgi:outer membrane protein assembly factor BamB